MVCGAIMHSGSLPDHGKSRVFLSDSADAAPIKSNQQAFGRVRPTNRRVPPTYAGEKFLRRLINQGRNM